MGCFLKKPAALLPQYKLLYPLQHTVVLLAPHAAGKSGWHSLALQFPTNFNLMLSQRPRILPNGLIH